MDVTRIRARTPWFQDLLSICTFATSRLNVSLTFEAFLDDGLALGECNPGYQSEACSCIEKENHACSLASKHALQRHLE